MTSLLRRRPLYVLLVAAAVALLAWAFWPRTEPVETARVVRAPLVTGFREEGRTRLRERYVVTAPVDGVVERALLEPGDPVATGRPVAVLRPGRAALLDPANRAQTAARLRASESELAAARATLSSLQEERRRTAAELERGTTLARQRLIAQSDLDALRSRAAAADAAVRSARARVGTLSVLRDGTRAVLALQGTAAGNGRTLTLLAPADGRVIRRHVDSESPVRTGQALLDIGDPRALEVIVDVLTEEAVSLQPGGRVHLSGWGGAGPLRGRIERIEPGGFTKVSALGVEEQRTVVVVALLDAPARYAGLGDGFRVEADFVTWHGEQIVQVPTAALFRDGEQWAVYVVESGRARLRRLQLGRVGERAAEVVSGVTQGDVVVLYPGDTVRDRSRVAAMR